MATLFSGRWEPSTLADTRTSRRWEPSTLVATLTSSRWESYTLLVTLTSCTLSSLVVFNRRTLLARRSHTTHTALSSSAPPLRALQNGSKDFVLSTKRPSQSWTHLDTQPSSIDSDRTCAFRTGRLQDRTGVRLFARQALMRERVGTVQRAREGEQGKALARVPPLRSALYQVRTCQRPPT